MNILDNPLFWVFIIIIPFFLLGAILFRSKKRHKRNIGKAYTIISKISEFPHPGQKFAYLRKIDPFVFEEIVLNSFKQMGYKVIRNRKYTGDGGIDGAVVHPNGQRILLQAKRYSSYINPRHVDDFSEIISKRKAHKGLFVHTGKSSSAARYRFFDSNVEIIGGQKLLHLIIDNSYDFEG